MKKLIATLLLFAVSNAVAKDLGVHGHTFKIAEPDLLEAIQSRLQQMASTGRLQELQQQWVEQAQKRLLRPQPVQNITKTTVARTWTYDPSLTVSSDLKDHQGKVFHKAGTRINPLQYRAMTKPLIFFDGDDPEQVAWVEEHYIKPQSTAKLILVNAAPFEWMEKWDREVFFDQQGRLTQKFGITQVPARISQQGHLLHIEELIMNKQATAENN